MSSSAVIANPAVESGAARKSFALMFCCTLIGALAQILLKTGTAQVGAHITLGQVAHDPSLFFKFSLGILANPRMFFGYLLLGVNTALVAVALKGRELSRLYPIIALTYVWVTFLSIFALPGEHLNVFRTAGIAAIVTGVSVLGLKK